MKFAHTVATPDTADETMLALRGDLEANFRALGQLGYSAVELMVRDPASLDADAIASLARDAGLQVVAVSTGQLRKEDGLSLSHPDGERRLAAVARTKQVVDFAARFGAQVNIGTVRGRDPSGAEASFRELLSYAAERDVKIAVEPQCKWVSNWLNTVEETLRWREAFDPAPWLLLDYYHASLEEASVEAALIRAWPALAMVQISDSNRRAPGWGHAPPAGFLRVLEAMEYDGFVMLECVQQPGGLAAAEQTIRWAAAHGFR